MRKLKLLITLLILGIITGIGNSQTFEWKSIPSPGRGRVAIANNGQLFAGTNDGGLRYRNEEDSWSWVFELVYGLSSTLRVNSDGWVFMTDSDGSFITFAKNNGKVSYIPIHRDYNTEYFDSIAFSDS